MKIIKDSRAFPSNININEIGTANFGLTKRELISAMCLQSVIANYNCVIMDVKTKTQHAKEAVKWSDALLLELSKERE